MGWLSGWDKRVKITIDHNDVNEALSNFPILLYLSASSGLSAADVTFIFDELQHNDTNRKKIAVTTSDGETQCYVEIERWDSANEKAWLWVKVPSIAADVDTELYLYYDKDHADNTSYVGDTGETPAQNVWDSNFAAVWHLNQSPGDSAPQIKDSTANGRHLTCYGSMTSDDLVDAKIGKGIDLDGVNDELANASSWGLSASSYTLELWLYPRSTSSVRGPFGLGPNKTSRSLNDETQVDGVNHAQAYSNNSGSWCNTDNDSLPSNAWTYEAFQHDLANDILRVTLNSTTWSWSYSYDVGAHNYFTLGRILASTPYLSAIVDEVRYSRVIRSSAWIKATYEATRDHFVFWGSEETSGGAALVSVSDMLGFSDAVLCSKNLAVLDSAGLVEANLADKAFAVFDGAVLSDFVSLLTVGFIQVFDSVTLADAISVDRAFSLHDSVSLLDDVLVHKQLVAVADALALSGAVAVVKVLVLSDEMMLVEAVDVGLAGARKTRVFLVFGDLAVQVVGD
ncbi:MAG: DUF2341 domain-containing protein [Candidatus Bathyarchaeia archaeon]